MLLALLLGVGAEPILAQSPADSQVRTILQGMRAQSVGKSRCNESSLETREQALSALLSRQDHVQAARDARALANSMAACAVLEPAAKAAWSERVGRLLALSVVETTQIRGARPTSELSALGDDAVVLLSYAAAAGSTTADAYLDGLSRSRYRSFN